MHPRTQVDEPFRSVDERGEDVGRERVDREDKGETIDGRAAPALSVADARVVDDGIEGSEAVHLVRDIACLTNARQVTDDYGLGTRNRFQCLRGTLAVARVQNDAVFRRNHEAGGHLAQAVG